MVRALKNRLSRLFGGVGLKETEIVEKELDAPELEHTEEDVIQNIPLANIRPNRYQPRTKFDEEKIAELAKTLHTHGIIQPIVVRKLDEDRYEIIAGERRYRAAQRLGWDTIPAIVREMNDKETASLALIENIQREELSPIEEARAYQQLIEIHNLTQEALAQRLGKGQSTIANKLRLLKLPDRVQEALLNKEITERHARAILPLKDEEKQLKILEEIIEKNLNVKQTEARVEKMLTGGEAPKPKRLSVSRDVRIAVNTIRQSIKMIEKSGIALETSEEEADEYYEIKIRIPKKKSS